MKTLTIITNVQAKILKALGRYHYLTRSQLGRLDIAGASGLYTALRDLSAGKRPLISKRDLGVIPRNGRLPHLFFLAPRGAKLLAQNQERPLDQIRYPKKAVLFTHDFQHRVNTIDCHIALHVWAKRNNAKVDFVETYFRDQKTILLPPNAEHLIPDMTTMIDMGANTATDEHRYLLSFEIYNQTRTTRVIQQLEKHAQALRTGAYNDTYNFTRRSYRLFCVFDTQRNMELVIKRLAEVSQFEDVYRAIYFKSLPDIVNDFGEGWKTLSGEKRDAF